jgi:PAS domain S-box-containing protein
VYDPGVARDTASRSIPRPPSEEGEVRAGSLLESVARLKEQILEKDRIINARTQDLVATRDYLQGVFAALADAVLVLDRRGVIEFANEAAHDLLGWPKGALVGRPASALVSDPVQAALFEGERLAEALQAPNAFQRVDLLLRARDDRPVPVVWSSSVLRGAIGAEPQGLVGIARDVSVERRMNEEKQRMVQALAASVAHEIRNPLGAIQSSVALLRRDLDLEGEDRTLMDIVLEETQRIGRIVTQFLDFARPPRLEVAPVDVGGLLREVVLLAEQDDRARGGKQLLLHIDPELAPLVLDAGQVKQVVWNLLSNALDAAHERIAVRLRAAPGGVEVRVADDGPGMPPDVLARAFVVRNGSKAQGTGLGLTISKRIVEDHGGTLRLESAAGQGTTASFVLPRREP